MRDYATYATPRCESLTSRLVQIEEDKADKQEERWVLKAHIKTQCASLIERRNRLNALLSIYTDIASTL